MSGLTEYSKTYKPFKYPWAMEAAEEHEKIHWGTWEVKLQEDVSQWKGGVLSEEEKNFVTQILRVFTQSDVAVGGNYCDIFIPAFRNNEIRNMLLSFANREGTHQRAYALLNDTLGLPEREYESFLHFNEMRDKIEFMTQAPEGLGKATHLAFELARSVCNEGMSLFSAFSMLLNFQRFGKMKGTCEIVEWSIKDEMAHIEGITKLFLTYCEEHPRVVTDKLKGFIYTNYTKAVELEDALVDLVFEGVEMEGLTAQEVKTYVRYLADRRLLQLRLKPVFKQKENPLKWVDWIVSGDEMKNFFEGTVTSYSQNGMVGELNWDGILGS